MIRLYGWAEVGHRLVDAVPHGHWNTSTFTAGLRQDGLVAPCVFNGAYRATAKLAGRIASSRSVPERAGRCLIRMLPALECFVKRRTVGMRDCGCW